MARTQILVSDLSGETIEAGTEALITVKVNGKVYTGEASRAEVEGMVSNFRETKRRGRKPKSSGD